MRSLRKSSARLEGKSASVEEEINGLVEEWSHPGTNPLIRDESQR